VTVIVCVVPAIVGVGSPVVCVAELKFVDVMVEVEYLKSYCVAVPVFVLSPGAVQVKEQELFVQELTDKFEIAEGAIMSGQLSPVISLHVPHTPEEQVCVPGQDWDVVQDCVAPLVHGVEVDSFPCLSTDVTK